MTVEMRFGRMPRMSGCCCIMNGATLSIWDDSMFVWEWYCTPDSLISAAVGKLVMADGSNLLVTSFQPVKTCLKRKIKCRYETYANGWFGTIGDSISRRRRAQDVTLVVAENCDDGMHLNVDGVVRVDTIVETTVVVVV